MYKERKKTRLFGWSSIWAIMISITSLNAQQVTIPLPDANFRLTLVNHGGNTNFPSGYYHIADNGNGTVTVHDIDEVDTLFPEYCNIADLSGIEYFTTDGDVPLVKLLNEYNDE